MRVHLGIEVPRRGGHLPGRGRHLVRGDDMSETICSVEGCGKPVRTRGWCHSHYLRWWRHGNPLGGGSPKVQSRGLADMPSLLVANSERQGECLVWTWHCTRGYGVVSVGGRLLRVHRVVWELANGPIPDGMNVCHHCDNPPCFELSHLFLGTQAENIADMIRKGRQANGDRLLALECPNGHEFTAANTIMRSNGWRVCRACKNERQRQWRAARCKA